MQAVVARRLDLLKLEAQGFSRPEIIKELTTKYQVTTRCIRYDYERRSHWQPYFNEELTDITRNRYEQLYRTASLKLMTATGETAQVGWANVLLRVIRDVAEIFGVAEAQRVLNATRSDTPLVQLVWVKPP
jgi:hypothetical protein